MSGHRWPWLPALALTLALAVGAPPALAQAAPADPNERLQQARQRWVDAALLPSPRAAAADGAAARRADAAWAAEAREALLARVRLLDGPTLLQQADLAGPAIAMPTAVLLSDGLSLSFPTIDGPMPPWLLAALRRQVASASLPARRLDQPLPTGTWLDSVPQAYGDQTNWAQPAVWAGPAVRDGVADYRREGGHTRIRLAIGNGMALWELARSRGVAVRLRLDDASANAFGAPPLHMELQLPVWLLTPQQLLPATLTALRYRSDCALGYTELQLAGDSQPAVWAVLFLPDEASGRAAQVRRIAPPPEPEGQVPGLGARRSSRLEVSWPDGRLPALHVVARRFGELWGSYVQLAQPGAGDMRRISAAGSPECALR